MTGPAGFLAGWRAWRAAQAAEPVPSVPGAAQPPGTEAIPQESNIVPGVPAVPDENEKDCTERRMEPRSTPAPTGSAWRLSEPKRAAALARPSFGAEVEARAAFYARFQAEAAAALAQREPDPIEAAERAAVFDGGGEARAYQRGEPDPLRDGLLRGWRDHRGLVWSPDGPIRDT